MGVRHWTIGVCVVAGLVLAPNSMPVALAQPATGAGATYTADGRLEFPKDFRKWVFLSSGMDMSYVDNAPRTSTFGNVFANPEAYDAFLKNGTWPDKTILVLDVRKAERQSGAFLKNGQFQSDAVRTEAHVKDASRGGWSFYNFSDEGPATRIPNSATCYSCHQDHGAADTAFVQFYPTLLPTARAKQTLSAGYLADVK